MSEQPSASRARSERPTWVSVDPNEDEQRRPPLTRPRIVRAAMRLVDEQGLAALTMRALANELGVSPMALYNHVRDKEELVDLMADLMLGEVDCSPSDGDWMTQLRTLVCSLHQVLSAHPGLARIYGLRVRIGPHGLSVMERALGLLRDAGFSPPEAANAFFALFTYTMGFHQMGRIDPRQAPTPGDETAYYSALPTDRIPTVAALIPHLDGVRQTGRFEYGLEILLTGLQARLTGDRRHPRSTGRPEHRAAPA